MDNTLRCSLEIKSSPVIVISLLTQAIICGLACRRVTEWAISILLKLKQVSETNLIASRVMHKTLGATQTCNWAEVQSDGGQVVMGGWFGWLHAPIEVML